MSGPRQGKQFEHIKLQDFDVYVTTLRQNEDFPMLVGNPEGFRINDSDYGLNTYRSNAVVSGEFRFNRVGMVPFTRSRGQSPQDNRICFAGDYWLSGLQEENVFVCVMAKNFRERFYDYVAYPVAPGESITIPRSELTRDFFVVQGALEHNGRQFENFRHLSLTQDKEYEFTNTTEEPAFAIYVYQISKVQARQTAEELFPEWHQAIGILRD